MPPSDIARVHFANLDTGEDIELPANPNGLREQLKVLYARMRSLGGTGSRLEYTGTDNHRVNLQLYYRSMNAAAHEQLQEHRKFLLSLLYPTNAGGVTAAPPLVLFVWPTIIELPVRLVDTLSLRHQLSNPKLETTYMLIDLVLEAQELDRLTSDRVRNVGTLRPPGR